MCFTYGLSCSTVTDTMRHASAAIAEGGRMISSGCHYAAEATANKCRHAWNGISEATAAGCRSAWEGVSFGYRVTATQCHRIGVSCVNGSVWLGHSVKYYVLDPSMDAGKKGWTYFRNHYITVTAHLVTWGIILVFCGALYGFKTVALPMSIGMGPGVGFGLVLGVVAHKAFEEAKHGHTWTWLQRTLHSIPRWTKTLLIALAASASLAACSTMPYATGGFAGCFIGCLHAYSAADYDPNAPAPSYVSPREKIRLARERAEKEKQQDTRLQTQETAIVALQQKIRELENLLTQQQQFRQRMAAAFISTDTELTEPPKYTIVVPSTANVS